MTKSVAQLTEVSCIVIGIIALAIAPCAFAGGSSPSVALQSVLTSGVASFDNRGQALIPTLIEIAAVYGIPMGIEKVTTEALRTSVHITLRRGTVADLLDACVRQLPDYHWAAQEGAVDIYGEKERTQKLNLFNYVIPSLEVKGGDLNLLNARLRMMTPETLAPGSGPVLLGGAEGVAGDSPGVGGLEPTRTDLQFRHATVRSILNRIVALSKGKAIWIARVSPSELGHAPSQGLWLLAPPSASAISSLGPSLKSK